MVLCSLLVHFGNTSAYLRYSSFKVKFFGAVGDGVGLGFLLLWDRGEGAVEMWQGAVEGRKVSRAVCWEEQKWKTNPKTGGFGLI